jgi:hypothetical protein
MVKMKKSIMTFFFILLTVVITLTSCDETVDTVTESEPPQILPTATPDKDEINEFYTVSDDETDLATLLFLGTDETFDEAKALIQAKYFSDLPEQWPERIETVEANSWEIYLLLPKYKDTVMTVYERNMEHYENEDVAFLTEIITTGDPVLLKCNFSDIFPSIEIRIEHGEEATVCVPSISNKDGSVMAGERIYTEDVPQQLGTSNKTPEPISLPDDVNKSITETVLSFSNPSFGDQLEQEKLRDIVRAGFDDKEQMDSFVSAYLNERGMYKPIPDATYGYGDYYVEYYKNEELKKTSFILQEDENMYFVYCISFSWDDLSEIGSKVYELDEKQNIVLEGVYATGDLCAAYASYEYMNGIPFPFIDRFYIEYTELVDGDLYADVFHMNQRFWLEKQFADIDETGKVNGYNADLYHWSNAYTKTGAVYNDFVYDEKGKLTAINEAFSEDGDSNTAPREFATDITLDYREDDTLSVVNYGFDYTDIDTHSRGSGDSSGTIFYDEQGRMSHRTYYMTHGAHSGFYLYDGDAKTPWAYIDTGGLAYSGDDVSEYGFGVSVYLFQPLATTNTQE